MTVTIIVPCWNEEEGMPSLLDRLAAVVEPRSPQWTVLAVNDGSSDRTAEILDHAAGSHAWLRVVHHERNKGLGAAVRTGIAAAQGDIVCTIDSDCTYPPERLPEFVLRIEAGADMVTASPWHPENRQADASPLRITLSKTVSGLYRVVAGGGLHTYTCLYRAYRRERLAGVKFASNGFSAITEILVKGLLAGWRVEEVPMPLEARRYGASKMTISQAILGHLRLLRSTVGWVLAHKLGGAN